MTSPETAEGQRSRRPTIVQAARAIGPGGGVNGVAFNLEREFQRRGYTCRRFTLDEATGRRRQPTASSSIVWQKLVLLFDAVVYATLGTWRLRRSLASGSDCVVLCHGEVLAGDIYVNHGLHKAMWKSRGDRWWMLVRNPLHVFLLLREAVRHRVAPHRRFVCFSEADKRQLTANYSVDPDRVVLIPNGVDTERFHPSEQARHEFRARHGVAEDRFVALFVGHEFVRKGLRFVIEALPLLPDDVTLWVVGDDRSSIDQHRRLVDDLRLTERVRFWGRRQDVEALYQASDAFVLPTLFEPWGLVGLEAMACKCPAVMPPVGGIPEYLEDGRNGFFVAREPADIAAKLRRLREDPDLRDQLRSGARDTAERFSWTRIAGEYVSLIETVHEEALRETDGHAA